MRPFSQGLVKQYSKPCTEHQMWREGNTSSSGAGPFTPRNSAWPAGQRRAPHQPTRTGEVLFLLPVAKPAATPQCQPSCQPSALFEAAAVALPPPWESGGSPLRQVSPQAGAGAWGAPVRRPSPLPCSSWGLKTKSAWMERLRNKPSCSRACMRACARARPCFLPGSPCASVVLVLATTTALVADASGE
jgi:hypothetical protein